MRSFLDRLEDPRPILLDGATGTELNRRGADTSLPLWSARALWDAPDVLRQIHGDYVEAGAEVVTANTFGTHQGNLARSGLQHRAGELTHRAVDIARTAANGRAFVAGSLAPIEDCYRPDLVSGDDLLEIGHRAMAVHLAETGIDLILVETHNTIREAVVATEAASQTRLPVLVSFVCGNDGRLLSGETISQALAAVVSFGPKGVLVNCVPVQSVPMLLEELRTSLSMQSPQDDRPPAIGAYANIGYADPAAGWVNTDAQQPEAYARHAAGWLRCGARLIGGCCGTTPEHIRQLRRLV